MQFNNSYDSLTNTEDMFRKLNLLYRWFEDHLEYKQNHAISPARMWQLYNKTNDINDNVSLKTFYSVLRSFVSELNAKNINMSLVRKSEGHILLNAHFILLKTNISDD